MTNTFDIIPWVNCPIMIGGCILSMCKKCKYHIKLLNDQVQCNALDDYHDNIL